MAELQRHNLMLVVYFFIWVARKARELTPRSKKPYFPVKDKLIVNVGSILLKGLRVVVA